MRRVSWSRATVNIDGTEYDRVRFVADEREGVARVFDAAGNLLAQTVGPTTMSIGRRTAVVATGEGSTWNIAKVRNCGCG